MRSVSLIFAWSDYPRWRVVRESPADGSQRFGVQVWWLLVAVVLHSA